MEHASGLANGIVMHTGFESKEHLQDLEANRAQSGVDSRYLSLLSMY